jgi:serine/threonine protein kinase
MAPETFDPRVSSTCSDIWSFGMVIYEILTRKDPYHEYSLFTVIFKIANGTIPNRPETITNDKIWNLMTDCWMLEPTERLSIQDVISRLEEF